MKGEYRDNALSELKELRLSLLTKLEYKRNCCFTSVEIIDSLESELKTIDKAIAIIEGIS